MAIDMPEVRIMDTIIVQGMSASITRVMWELAQYKQGVLVPLVDIKGEVLGDTLIHLISSFLWREP